MATVGSQDSIGIDIFENAIRYVLKGAGNDRSHGAIAISCVPKKAN